MNHPSSIGAKPKNPAYLTELARQNRQSPTEAEILLWGRLRNRRFWGLKFRRQHILGRYVVDFFAFLDTPDCPGIVIELDGGIHADQVDYDYIRDEWMKAQGYHVVRIPNETMLREPKKAMNAILIALPQGYQATAKATTEP